MIERSSKAQKKHKRNSIIFLESFCLTNILAMYRMRLLLSPAFIKI